ncbi:MAG: Ig-like domain-containing protein [Anaerolineae bacterium]
MNKRVLYPAAMLLLIMVVGACGSAPTAKLTPTPSQRVTPTPRVSPTPVPPRPAIPFTPVAPDALSPIVIQRTPKRGQSLSPNGAIELIFDKPMDEGAVAKALHVERAGTSEVIEGALSWADERTVRFKPATDLPRDTTFDVILTQAASAKSGEPLAQPYTFRFSTVGNLSVAQVIPAADTTDVETDATLTVIFDRPVVPLTTLAQMENLPDPLTLEPEVAGTGEWLNTSIYVFRPEETLAGGMTYRATISAGLEDIAGNALIEDHTWQFTTAPPKIVWVKPPQDATLVDINAAISVAFNQPIDPASARNAFHLRSTRPLANDVRGDFTLNGNTLIFTPTNALAHDTRYTLNIDAGVTSAAGGAGMVEAFTSSFTTVPLPEIVETDPADGDKEASPYTEFQIVFNTPIDPTTVMPNLTMSPPLSPTQVHTYYARYNNTFIVHFGAEPSTDYQVVIDDGIADPYGNTIPRGRTVNFRTAPLPPTYQLRTPEFIGTYDAALPARLVVAHVNLTRLDLRLYRMPISAITESPWAWQGEDQRPGRDMLVREWREELTSPLDQQQHTVVNLTNEPAGTLDPGIYLLEVEAPEIDRDRYGRVRRHMLVVSEFNLTLKTGPEEILVWATDLATGNPVPNLSLTVAEISRGTREIITTESQGLARAEIAERHHTVVVYSDLPFAAASDDWGSGIRPWDFGVGEGVYSQVYRTYVYTDRPIYRPGQTVEFKGVIRAEDDAVYSLPGIGEVEVIVRDVQGEELLKERLPVSEVGTFAGTLALPQGANLGEYVISVEFADQYSQSYFTVAAYRPPEFEVIVNAGREEMRRGEDVNASVRLSYYFGGPLKETRVQWNVLAERYVFEPPWGGGYTFSDLDDPYRCFDCWWVEPPSRESLMSGEGVTDAEGRVSINIDGRELADVLDRGAQRIIIEATATGPDNQQIAGRTTAIVHPGPHYIGLRPRTYVGRAGDESEIDLVAVDWEGNRLPSETIRVSFYRREWVNTFVENEAGGGRWTWETEETLVDESVVSTDELGEALATFVPAEGGSYHVVAAPASPTAETGHIRSSIFIWISGEDYISWRRENHDRITLVSDKTTYEVGETAEILIPSPFTEPHMALITVEREGVRRHEVLRLENNSTIYRLPIVAQDIPNIYVSVVLIKARGSDVADFKMGLLPLDVALDPRTLTIQVEPDRAQAQPGEDVTYTVTALDAQGRPVPNAELSLDLVDKAVLSLQPRSQDILGSLYARRMLEVRTASSLSVSVNRYQEKLVEDLDIAEEVLARQAVGMGGEEMEMPAEAPAPMATMPLADAEKTVEAALPAGMEVREEFADTAFWEAWLVTNAQGRATATVSLPDNLTTWVVRAVGLTVETVVGEGTAEVVATKPVLVRPVAPRFFVVDDRAQLAANVSNNTDDDLDVEVGLNANGIRISEETPETQSVRIRAHSETKVTWWVTVEDQARAELIFSARAGEYTDASRPRLTTGPDGTLLVLRYTAPDTVGTAGQLVEGGARAEAIALPPEFDERRGQLTVRLDPSLAAAMQDGLDYLEYYEYECTEQTVSRFLPNVLTYNALTSLSIEAPELVARLPGLVEEGLTKLYMQQNPDGGWGWWHRPREPQSNAYISGYVVFAMLKAREAGFAVNSEVLNRGIGYLKSQVTGTRDFDHYRDANRQAWLLYVLTEGGAASSSDLTELYDHREKLSTYARSYLAQALWLVDSSDARLSTLLSDINNAAILSATGAHWEESHHDWWAMNTDTRSTAIVLDTLAKLDAGNELIPNVVRWLMVARQTGIWETTQETAWALIALTDWMVETGELDANYEFALYLNELEQARSVVTPERVREGVETVIPIADLRPNESNALTIARTDGPGRLYYTAHLQVYLPVEAIETEDRGFTVQRRYTLADCVAESGSGGSTNRDCPEVNEIRLGDVVRVDLTLITPHDRYYVIVEDPLPAGGEAIDTGLATTSLLAMDPRLQREESRYWWWWWWHWYSRSELRDEKVVLFADYLPAGTYEYSYTFRATLPGDYRVIPTTVSEFYFPEVFGRSEGRLLTITQ